MSTAGHDRERSYDGRRNGPRRFDSGNRQARGGSRSGYNRGPRRGNGSSQSSRSHNGQTSARPVTQ